GGADLAVTLRAVTVSNGEARPVDEHWQVERRAGDELLVVEIAAIAPWRHRRKLAPGRWRGHTQHTKERAQRDFHIPWQPANSLGLVDLDIGHVPFVEIMRQAAGERSHAGIGPVGIKLDGLD